MNEEKLKQAYIDLLIHVCNKFGITLKILVEHDSDPNNKMVGNELELRINIKPLRIITDGNIYCGENEHFIRIENYNYLLIANDKEKRFDLRMRDSYLESFCEIIKIIDKEVIDRVTEGQ